MDRSLNRILSLPLFDDEFVRALRLVHLDHVEFWLAVVDDRSIAVDSKIAGLVSAAQEDQNAKDLLLNRLDLLTMLAHLIEKSRPRIEGEIATDLGFGMSFGSAKSGPPDQGGRLAITMGGEVPVLPAKRPAPTGSRVEVTSLQNEEQIEKAKWAARLRQIAQKAGDAAKINDTSCMYAWGLQGRTREVEGDRLRSRWSQNHSTECSRLGEVRGVGSSLVLERVPS